VTSRAQRESGQAAVESAIVMPLMVFMCLGIIQLTMLQQAKLMTEYAAYQAARAGIVWNGNNERMHDAAIVALLPTMGHSDTIGHVAETWIKHQVYDTALAQLAWGVPAGAKSINASNLVGFIRVDTVNPDLLSPFGSDIKDIWKLRNGVNWQELDFDGPDAYPEVPNLETKIAKFFNLPLPDDQEEVYRKSTVLQIRLRYWYEMRIPFANWVIFLAWYASNADVALYGSIDRSTTTRQNMFGKSGSVASVGGQGKGIKVQRGFDTVYKPEMLVLWGLANGSIPLLSSVVGKRFFFPLSATYSMRMQSNFHKKWIMHF
jgi:hypothetical protein